jgi:hypothetical protein
MVLQQPLPRIRLLLLLLLWLLWQPQLLEVQLMLHLLLLLWCRRLLLLRCWHL